MYIIVNENEIAQPYETWVEVPDVKISSLTIYAPNLENNITIKGYQSYVCMKEALVKDDGFEIVANICYAINDKYSVKYRITNEECTSTSIFDSAILEQSLNKTNMRYGAKSDFVI